MLIRSSNWLGDAVMSVPAVRAIKNGRPDAQVTIAAPAKIAALWKLVPEVDAIIPISDRSVRGSVQSIRQRGHFDAAILFPKIGRASCRKRESMLGASV